MNFSDLIKMNDDKLNMRLTNKEIEDQQSRNQQTKLLTEINKRLQEKDSATSSGKAEVVSPIEVQRWK